MILQPTLEGVAESVAVAAVVAVIAPSSCSSCEKVVGMAETTEYPGAWARLGPATTR